MLNNIKRQLKFQRLSTIFIVISYIITIIFISIGVSYLNESRNIYLDNNSGEPEKSLMLSVEFNKDFQVNDLLKYIIIKNYNYDIKTYSTVRIEDNDIVVWGHKFYDKPYWQPNILSGDYFDNKGYLDKNVAVVGSGLKEKCYSKNKHEYITLGGEDFSVIGFAGRENRDVHWKNTVYIPMECLNKDMITHLNKKGELQLLFLSNKTISETEVDMIINDLKSEFDDIRIIEISGGNKNETSSSLYNVFMICVLIFTVSIVNIIALTFFWILDKRKEITLRKLLGYTSYDITKIVLKEMMEIGLVSICLSFMLQILLNLFVNHFIAIDIGLQINNIIISISVVLISIIITSILPIKVILKTKATGNLNL